MGRRRPAAKKSGRQTAYFDLEQSLRLLRAFIALDDVRLREQLVDYAERLAARGASEGAGEPRKSPK